MILYTDKIPETPDECVFFQNLEPHEYGIYGCVLTNGSCGLECKKQKCDCLGLLPNGYSHDSV